jgi:hypothetical protein
MKLISPHNVLAVQELERKLGNDFKMGEWLLLHLWWRRDPAPAARVPPGIERRHPFAALWNACWCACRGELPPAMLVGVRVAVAHLPDGTLQQAKALVKVRHPHALTLLRMHTHIATFAATLQGRRSALRRAGLLCQTHCVHQHVARGRLCTRPASGRLLAPVGARPPRPLGTSEQCLVRPNPGSCAWRVRCCACACCCAVVVQPAWCQCAFMSCCCCVHLALLYACVCARTGCYSPRVPACGSQPQPTSQSAGVPCPPRPVRGCRCRWTHTRARRAPHPNHRALTPRARAVPQAAGRRWRWWR